MSCSSPIDVAVLADYWAAVLPKLEEEAVEEHLFTCDECGSRLREVISLAEGVRNLARQGSLMMTVSSTFLKRIGEEGLRVREYTPPKGGSIACTVTGEDDFLIGHLTADLSQAKRVDLSICDPNGVEQQRLADVPFAPGSAGIVFEQPIDYAKAAPSSSMIARLFAIDDEGMERLLGEYTFNHTRTIPGPAAW